MGTRVPPRRLKKPAVLANPVDVANFLASKARHQQSIGAINTLAAVIAHNHTKRFYPSPTEHRTVRLPLESIKKNYNKPVQAKWPLTRELLNNMMD